MRISFDLANRSPPPSVLCARVYSCEQRSPPLCVCVCVRTPRYKGLLFTARFIFHRNIMENGPNVMRGV